MSTGNYLKNNRRNGFILLFSLLISSVMLTAGLAVARIMSRQIYMASVQRNSQTALFAADAGLECGRYWKESGVVGEKKCNDSLLVFKDEDGNIITDLDTAGKIMDTWFNLGDPLNSGVPKTCTQVFVDNKNNKIVARGYNVECDDNTGTPVGGQVVERELVYLYQ